MLKQLAAGNKNWDACNTSPASAPLVNTVNTVGATNIADERYTIKHSNGNITGSDYGVYYYVFRSILKRPNTNIQVHASIPSHLGNL